MSDWRRDVLTYWFGLTKEQWFESDPAGDANITERFHDLYERKRELPASNATDVKQQVDERPDLAGLAQRLGGVAPHRLGPLLAKVAL